MGATKLMDLTETPKIVAWPETHYVYIEETGPFLEAAPKAWGEMGELSPLISELGRITGKMALYKHKAETLTYRAGFALVSSPAKLPAGLKYEKFKGGKYSCFVLKGPYTNLPVASGRVNAIVEETKIERRDDFCIEHYINDPQATPPDQLITEILIPTH